MEYVLFHAREINPFRPCPDGLFAAYAAKLAIPEVVLLPAKYGEPPKLSLKSGDRVYLLDLTYPAPALEDWADMAEVIILDHHKQALLDLQFLSERVTRNFDLTRSGAVIAWEYFFPGKPVPELFKYVQDRDLWEKRLPNCDLVSLGLAEVLRDSSVPEAMETIASLLSDPEAIKKLAESGTAIQTEIQEAIDYAVKHHSTRCVMGWSVPFFKATTARQRQALSDIGNALCEANPNAPFSIVQAGGGWGLRSQGRTDVSKIAKLLGGGGHPSASGCRSELPEWLVF